MKTKVNHPLIARILAALATGQMHKQMLCTALNLEYSLIDPTMAQLRRDGRVITLGIARDAGYEGVHAHAPVYGLPGMTLKIVERRKESRGSGVVAGRITIPSYVWGASRL